MGRSGADGPAPAGPVPATTTPDVDDGGRGAVVPGAEGLDAELLARFDVAREAAAADGIELRITSGRRSAAEQQRLLDEAIARDGLDRARRTVLPPEVSAHVAGTAIDVGPREGAAWLEERSSEVGLCRTYENEWWHFELVGAVGERCPTMRADASHGWE
ncbi:peptidase M15 [Serinibacter arcticus]|uniref:Peptidase M15 n=1 Tax=Serinibacter arcticus TaxID=1655435 RepID=A0A2U2A0A1_9MICO|nr:peptidase M15 [Serinibacter arcticus]